MKHPNTLVVDVDGTLITQKVGSKTYVDAIPNRAVIDKLHRYKTKGYRIILYTSRNMKSYDNDLAVINKYTAPELLLWLTQWEIPYDGILFGKPWVGSKGFYIDDKAIRPNEFLTLSEDEIHELIGSA